MGKPMAVRLLQAGYEVTVYNRNPAPADELARQGARKAITLAQAAAGAELAISMLADDAAAREVLGLHANAEADRCGLLAGLREGGVHISMSTLGLDCIREMAQAHARHRQGFIATPVFGRPEAAAAGKLWVLAAGAARDLEIGRPVLRALGQGVLEVGDDPAAAMAVKIAGNFTLAAMLETLGEAMALVKKAGIAPALFLDMIQRIYQSPMSRPGPAWRRRKYSDRCWRSFAAGIWPRAWPSPTTQNMASPARFIAAIRKIWPWHGATSMSGIYTSTANAPAPWSAPTLLAALIFPAPIPKPVAPIICSFSPRPKPSPKKFDAVNSERRQARQAERVGLYRVR